MQDVATRVDQSCRRCARGEKCVYATWSAAYIWAEVEQALFHMRRCSAGYHRRIHHYILNLMWHYGQAQIAANTKHCPICRPEVDPSCFEAV